MKDWRELRWYCKGLLGLRVAQQVVNDTQEWFFRLVTDKVH